MILLELIEIELFRGGTLFFWSDENSYQLFCWDKTCVCEKEGGCKVGARWVQGGREVQGKMNSLHGKSQHRVLDGRVHVGSQSWSNVPSQ